LPPEHSSDAEAPGWLPGKAGGSVHTTGSTARSDPTGHPVPQRGLQATGITGCPPPPPDGCQVLPACQCHNLEGK